MWSEPRRANCMVRNISRRPCAVICSVFAASLLCGLGVFLLGDLDVSTQEALFQDKDDVYVKRWDVGLSLKYSAASSTAVSSGRLLATTTRRTSLGDALPHAEESDGRRPVGEGRRLQGASCRDSRTPGFYLDVETNSNFEIAYAAKDGGSILRATHMQEVLGIELELGGWLQRTGACALVGTAGENQWNVGGCACAPPDSALNYLFPSRAASGNASLQFNGLGAGSSATSAQAGVNCGPALTQAELESSLRWLTAEVRPA